MTPDRIDKLRDFARRYSAAWCSQDAGSVAGCFAPTGPLTINGGMPSVGRAAITEAAQGFMTAFPDVKVYMDDLVEKGDKDTWTLEGTNSGPGGAGKRVRISGFEEWRPGNDGLLAESLGNFDAAECQRQIEHGVDGQ